MSRPGRPASGRIEERELADGTVSYKLRFSAGVHGRQSLTVYSRHRCSCREPYCEGGGWTRRRAQELLDEQLTLARFGRWEPPPEPLPEDLPADAPTMHEYASAWLLRWKAGEFGRVPDEVSVADMRDWRLGKHLLKRCGRWPVDEQHFTLKTCAKLKADMLVDAQRLRDLQAEVDHRTLPVDDALRLGLLEEVVHGSGDSARTYRRPRVPLSPRSIQMVCRALAQILDAAVLDGLVPANPARGKHMAIKLPKPSRTWLERDEVLSVLDAASLVEGEGRTVISPLTARIQALAAEGLTPRQIAPLVGLHHTSI